MSATTPPPQPDRYVPHILICLVMVVIPYALILFMFINAYSMFEFHMLVIDVVMLNIVELIMKIMPNYPIKIPT
jgi:hypothetical protein